MLEMELLGVFRQKMDLNRPRLASTFNGKIALPIIMNLAHKAALMMARPKGVIGIAASRRSAKEKKAMAQNHAAKYRANSEA